MISTTSTGGQKIHVHGYPGMEVDLGGVIHSFSEDEFLDFCRRHPDARIERESSGEIVIMAPTYSETGGMNFSLTGKFSVWVEKDGTGKGFDSSTGFVLPNGAIRAPYLSWIKLDRWEALPNAERAGFAHICPDFVVELSSQTDTLVKLRSKMNEYLDNGASRGWLIDPLEKKVYIYRPSLEVEVLENPPIINGEHLLEGFTLNLKEIWG